MAGLGFVSFVIPYLIGRILTPTWPGWSTTGIAWAAVVQVLALWLGFGGIVDRIRR